MKKDKQPIAIKPPIGLRPRFMNDTERFNEVTRAIERYRAAQLKIPIEWVEEYNELIELLN